MKYGLIFGIIFTLGFSQDLFGQSHDSILTVFSKKDNFRPKEEQVYVHTDKNIYYRGETIWFKIFDWDLETKTPFDFSQIAYLEILNNHKEKVFEGKTYLRLGQGYGSIKLPNNFTTGPYTLRVYTRWMRNFDEIKFFHKSLYLINPNQPPQKPEKDQSKTIQYDAQLFPEGGNLIYSLKSKIAARLISSEGKEIDFKGFILNQRNDTIVQFQSLNFGLGSFFFEPIVGNIYRILLIPKGKSAIQIKTPEILKSGYVIHLEDQGIGIDAQIQASPEMKDQDLILSSSQNGKLDFEKGIQVQNQKASLEFLKSSLTSGLHLFTLLKTNHEPLAERLYYIAKPNRIPYSIDSLKTNYSIRKPLDFWINMPISTSKASFSLAISFQDSFSKSLPNLNILEYREFQSYLKGNVNHLEYYLLDNPASRNSLENLILSQGWTKYKEPKFIYFPELNGSIISGYIFNKGNQIPQKDNFVFLSFPSIHPKFYVGKTDSNGRFEFKTKRIGGNQQMILQVKSPSPIDYEIRLDKEYSEDPIFAYTNYYLPDYSDYKSIFNRNLYNEVENRYYNKLSVLNNEKDLSADDQAFYGTPDFHYDLDNYTRFPTIQEVLTEYVRLTTLANSQGHYHLHITLPFFQKVYTGEPLYLLDGVPVFTLDPIMKMNPMKIKTLDVVNKRYFYGPLSSDGILSFQTYKGDLNGFELDSKADISENEGLMPEKEFFSPVYNTFKEIESKVPDFRTTLFWNPNLLPDNEGKIHIKVYTSDLKGEYKIDCQGVNSKGEVLIIDQKFQVKGN